MTGSGSGCTVTATVSNEVVTAVAVQAAGTGYQVGDVLTVDNSHSGVKRGAGLKFVIISINNTSLDTLYLTDVQGEKFTNDQPLVTYGAANDTRAVLSGALINGDSVVNGDLYSGKVFEVTQYNHAHHGLGNKVDIKDVEPDTELVATTSSLNAEGTTVSIANTTPFATFGGISTDRGEALIGEELVSYVVGTGQLSLTRGILTVSYTHLTLPTTP